MTDGRAARERLRLLRKAAERPFIRNQYGLWCPNCEEQIDELWPDACDHCGYPNKDYTRFDEDDDDWEDHCDDPNCDLCPRQP